MSSRPDGNGVDFSARQDRAPRTDDLFVKRWSPRSLTSTPIPQDVKESLFDSARFAPSSYNVQPWRFITNRNTPEDFARFLNFLLEQNALFAKRAALIGILVTKNHRSDGQPNRFAMFDAGAAMMSLSLQAQRHGLYVHVIGGIKYDVIAQEFGIDTQKYTVCCGFAVGGLGSKSVLSDDLSKREIPSSRLPLRDIWREGVWWES